MANTPLFLLITVLPALTLSVNVKIVNGTEVVPNSRPYMASVQENGKHVCGGFLVARSYVMTAAHCWKDGRERRVVLGVHKLAAKKIGRLRVKHYAVFPEYDDTRWKYDIMLLELKNKVRLSNKVRLISLPERDEDVKAGTNCTIAGWGAKSTSGPTVQRLMEANVQIMDREECKRLWGKSAPITPQLLCAYGGAGFCKGDSGGPLVCDGKAVGVASFFQKKNCNNPTLPNVYTKISAYLPWVYTKISSFLLWIKAIIGRKP
ncbi:complement factor D-like [Chanos chanos]|uniref:Complement factor D-like n=1 Tax=Chanos chanos TaxID=29144 RepID=A0A6J2W858_CHACN|nr:complement factor D-like [Chanos chanos]